MKMTVRELIVIVKEGRSVASVLYNMALDEQDKEKRNYLKRCAEVIDDLINVIENACVE